MDLHQPTTESIGHGPYANVSTHRQRGSAASFPSWYEPMSIRYVYKVVDHQTWKEAQSLSLFRGAGIDQSDGFIHLSTASQVVETVATYFSGVAGLVLVKVDTNQLGDELKWEASRNGDLFPHLYRPLPTSAVTWVKPLPIGGDGSHQFPDLD